MFTSNDRSKIINLVREFGAWHGRKRGYKCAIRITPERLVAWNVLVRKQTHEGVSATVFDALEAIRRAKENSFLRPKI